MTLSVSRQSRATVKDQLPELSCRIEALPEKEAEIYRNLLRLAKTHQVKHGRKHSGVYVFHTSAELLMDATESKRTRFYQALKCLKEAGLIAYKGLTHLVPTPGQEKRYVCSGTLFAVVMDSKSSKVARLTWWDYRTQHRDMALVLGNKTSVHSFRVQNEQTLQNSSKEEKYIVLERYTLSGVLNIHTVTPKCSVCSLPRKEFIFALDSGKLLQAQHRADWVTDCAIRLASLMKDQSLNLYRWILWKLLKASEQGLDLWSYVQGAFLNVLGDQEQNIPTNYGAVLVKKLKTSGLWSDLKSIC